MLRGHGASAFCLWLLGTRCAQRTFSQKQFLSWFLFAAPGVLPSPGEGILRRPSRCPDPAVCLAVTPWRERVGAAGSL